jgi:hypothetical protein
MKNICFVSSTQFNQRLRWIQEIIDRFLKAKVITRVELVSIQSKFQPFLLTISVANITPNNLNLKSR